MTLGHRYFRLIERRDRRRWISRTVFAAFLSLLEALCAVLIYYLVINITQPGNQLVFPVVGNLHQRFPHIPDLTLFELVAGVIALTFVARAVLVITQAYLLNRLVYQSGVALSRRLYQIYASQSYPWHLGRNSSELIRNVGESVNTVVQFLFVPLVGAAADVMVVAVLTVVLLVQAPGVTVAAGVFLGLLLTIIMRVLQPRFAQSGTTVQRTTRESLQTLQQSFTGIRDVKLLGRASFFENRYITSQAQQARANYTRVALAEVPKPAIEASAVLLILLFLLISRASAPTGTRGALAILGLFAYALLRIMPALNRVVSNVGLLRFGRAAADLVITDLDLPTAPPPSAAAPLRLHEAISVSGVSFRYPNQDADVLHDVSLRISRGESIGIVGSTGAGKTTLLDLLLGLLQPTSGTITIDGTDLQTNVEGWQATLGVVPQTHFLLDDTLRRNIALGWPDDEIDGVAVANALRLAQLESFVRSLPDGLDTVVGERGVRLSGGQRQRVTVARALYRNPGVLVLDEGTAALDNATEAAFITALEALRGQRTIITVAHRLSTVRNCTRIVFMADGRIVDIGTYEQLRDSSPRFRLMAEPG